MTTAVLPGSFDPFTVGHLDLAERALTFCDRLVVAVGVNSAKTPLFDVEKRMRMVRAATGHLAGVEVVAMDALLVDLCSQVGADMVVKGVRDGADVTWESTQAAVNRDLGGPETVWLPTRGELSHVSSSVVRELLRWGLDVSRYVPGPVVELVGDNGPDRRTEVGGLHG
ncbi:pantetheine-phosphate adenylyltransferase [Schaalia sp. 19OD2882]|uniref:pantetheine-phosphate adenylyltransferase n=1 Tax=Schaalia sp. 19OD2882 TaxID=2794089 RepID=UPI001C1EFD6A|nr:pantetheine-phosphate adenylyltransferase [Schaalia sp. 19OD2882]QWW18907.1 pantetheine-phosphate adenylyltransferase [Schaalia sp. 19OD2882]